MRKPLLSELTLQEKIGQMLSAYQHEINMKTVGDKLVRKTDAERTEAIQNEKMGTFRIQTKLFIREFSEGVNEFDNDKALSRDHAEWIEWEAMQYKIPALTATDAERNGPGPLFLDLTTTCPPMAMAATEDEELCYELGAAIGRELRCAGANWRWGPMVDVICRISPHMVRAYSDDPKKQAKYALAHLRGVQSQGVAATAKHFPGMDPYEYRDAHFSPIIISSTLEEWWAEQGYIFQQLIDGGVYSVMIGHVGFPAVEDSKVNGQFRPSSVSKKVVTDLLKNQMGFKGVVITDGISMGALYSMFTYEELLVESVNAGIDVILGSRFGAGKIIEKAVLDGRISEDRINDACQRVLDMKEKLGMFEEGYRYVGGDSAEVTPLTRKVNLEIARKGLTLVRDRKNFLPVDINTVKKVAIICSCHGDVFYGNLENVLKPELEARGIQVHLQRRLQSNAEIAKLAAENDLILYAAYISQWQPAGMPSFYDAECKTFQHAFTSGRDKSIGISFGYPYIHYDYMENADTFINAYGTSPDLMKAVVEAIFGDIKIRSGNSPVNLEVAKRKW